MASLYENLNALGRTTTKLEAILLWIGAIAVVARLVQVAMQRRRRGYRVSGVEYGKVSVLVVVMVLCGSLMFALSGANTPFARVLRAFSAGSLMAAPFVG